MNSGAAPPIAGVTATSSTAGGKGRVASPRGISTLMYACQQGDVDKVRRLLRAQPAAVKKRDRTGKTALHYCCTSDNICAAQAADVLVMAAPDLIETRDEDGFTPLHLAVIAGNMPLVTFLLANNADVNAVDSEKHTVVHWATVCGERGALRAVLAAGAPVSTPDVHGGYPLHYAAQMCGGEKDSSLGLEVLQTLLQHPDVKVNVEDGEGRQPLLWASSAGSAKAVLALIRAGATVDAPDKDGLTALHCAASRGHTDCIDTLLTLCGMSPDVIDSNGCTALHYSVTLGHADATALLLIHGADPNRQDRKGRSPAHCGCAKGQFETMKMIGNANANLWLRNARGDLPLHEAAASGRRDLVKWLLEARPSQVNARNNDGRCPLHLAALNDNPDMCKILLDAGAQVNPVLRTSKNVFMTPLDCALQRGFRSTAKYLQLHGGVPANRLSTSKINIPNGGVGIHVREDLTLWDDTTDSERENDEKDDKSNKRNRRRPVYRHEKKKEPTTAVGDDDPKKERSADHDKRAFRNNKSGNKRKTCKAEEGNENEKAKENVTYSSEVKITNNYGGINIERNGEIIIGDASPILQGASPVVASSKANMDAKIRQISEDKDNLFENVSVIDEEQAHRRNDKADDNKVGENSENIKMTDAEAQGRPSSLNIGENIEEIKSLASTIEQTAKSITKEVNIIQQNLQDDAIKIKQPDQHSLVSNTSAEENEHNELIVEASVHEPPKRISEFKAEETGHDEMAGEANGKKDCNATEKLSAERYAENLENITNETAEKIKSVHEKEVKSQEMLTETENEEMIKKQMEEEQLTKESETQKAIVEETGPVVPEVEDQNDTERIEIKEEIASETKETEVSDGKIEKADEDGTKIEGDETEIIEENNRGIENVEVDEKIEKESPQTLLDEEQEEGAIEEEEEEKTREDETLEQHETEEPKKEEGKEKIDSALSAPKEDTSDVSIETPDTVKLADQATLEDQKTLSDAEQKVESIEDDVKIQGIAEETESEKNEENRPDNVEETTKVQEADAGGVTAVSVECKNKQDHKRKFLKEKKSKKIDGETPREEGIRRDKTPRGNGSARDAKIDRKEKTKREIKTRDKASDRKDNTETVETTKREKIKEKIPRKAIEKILEVTESGTAPVVKLRKHRKTTDERIAKKKEKVSRRNSSLEDKSSDESLSSASESLIRKKRKHRSFTILEDGTVEKRRVRISKSKSPRKTGENQNDDRAAEESKTKLKRSKIPTAVSTNLRRELSISDQHLDRDVSEGTETRISLPNLLEERRYGNEKEVPVLPATSPFRQSAYSDNERSASDAQEDATRSAARRRRLRKRMKRDSRSAGSDYESSNLIDSGFEPSPRSSRIPKWRNMSERGVCMTSVTQSIQSNIRRYHLERKIFQHLLELKRLQIRSGQHNETVLVKRAIDDYHNSCAATVGAGRYIPEDYSFKSFEKFLYHSLRKLQKNGLEHLKGLPESPDNPLLCTQSTHRCSHATHAYTGIPCAAYLPKMDHHTIPKIGYPCKPSGFLPQINAKKTVTLELCHGGDKQVISLPTDRLDQNKRYYVTFTVKGNDPPSPTREDHPKEKTHRHAKSV